MAEINKQRHSKGLPIWLIFLPLIDLVLFIRYLIHGKNIALFNPKGLIASQQHSLIVFTAVVLLAVAIPVVCVLYFIAWRYRESNTKAQRNTNPHHNKSLDLSLWAIPTVVLFILAPHMWTATHKLVPQKTIDSSVKPLTIEVITLRWKWLFIYPDQQVASLNFVELPVNTPVTFEMTADETPMSSFWIPNLGGQLYTMTSHVNRLNLMATTAGDYTGSSAELNGAGFAEMRFTARATGTDNFNQWVQQTKQSPNVLDNATYTKLLKPSQANPPVYYSAFDPLLYANVIAKYEGPGGHTH